MYEAIDYIIIFLCVFVVGAAGAYIIYVTIKVVEFKNEAVFLPGKDYEEVIG